MKLIKASANALPLEDESVQTCVTSPPYWGLRAYAGEQLTTWADGSVHALGLEPTPELYVQHMVEVFREVRRVLRDDGTLWLNLGDSYAAGREGHGTRVGFKQGTNRASANGHDGARPSAPDLKPKDLVGIPWMVAFALRADGWYLRSDIIWHKPNPMPESVTDRPTKSHEYLFLLTKSERYFYDATAIRETGATGAWDAMPPIGGVKHVEGNDNATYSGNQPASDGRRNKRTVWTVATRPYSGAHFATFPPDLIEPCILAGSSPQACGVCGSPWARVVERTEDEDVSAKGSTFDGGKPGARDGGDRTQSGPRYALRATGDWRPTCDHDDGSAKSVVLDPFNGSGTTGLVAVRHNREYVGVDISDEYLALARQRIDGIQHTLMMEEPA
jgi:DNA modification methylase